jgi:hypothetical protein
MRYSNTILTELYEYFLLPALKNSDEFHSKERNGFTDVLQLALHERIKIKLVISSGISWLTDGPAGYADSLQVMYDWSQAHLFRMGKQGVGARSLQTRNSLGFFREPKSAIYRLPQNFCGFPPYLA